MKHFKEEPIIQVGLLTAKEITLNIPGKRMANINEKMLTLEAGSHKARISANGELEFITPKGQCIRIIGGGLYILQYNKTDFIEIENIEIGIDFHWNRKENQKFNGAFKIWPTENKQQIMLVNLIELEDYIRSVISSEMNGNSPFELLKAHAIISRSWLMAQLTHKQHQSPPKPTETETITWHDKQEHIGFHVCADDHCQRYQGITRAYNENVSKAIEQTRGMFLTYNNEICDARFSKCCGGKTENFETCWQDEHYNYLESVTDPYCNTQDEALLHTILNNYDAEYSNFYRWQVKYTEQELALLIKQKTGIDFGQIQNLKPLQRGKSGRIYKLEIEGTKKTRIFGKELEIRRILSQTHLYSSAFDVQHQDNMFIINGSGWGHGVGLCQIGAAVMATKGFNYQEILNFYFKSASIEKLY